MYNLFLFIFSYSQICYILAQMTERSSHELLLPANLADDDNAFLGEMYLRELGDVVTSHNYIAGLLAADCTQTEIDKARTATDYFTPIANEVRTHLHGTHMDMTSIYDRIKKHVMNEYGEQQSPESRLNKLLRFMGAEAVRSIKDEEKNPSSGLPFIIYVNAMIARVTRQATYDNPQEVIAKMEDTADESLHPILRAVMDFKIFDGARSGQNFTTAYPKADYASTPTVHRAMMRGLDAKVLSAAYNIRFGDLAMGMNYKDFIKIHASSDASADMLLHYIDGRAVSQTQGSGYTGRIAQHVVPSFRSNRLFRSQTDLDTEIAQLKERGNHVARELVTTLKRADTYRIEKLSEIVAKTISPIAEEAKK